MSNSRVFHLYDDGLSTSHCSLPHYRGNPGGNLVKTTPAIAGATSCDSLIYLRVDRQTQSCEWYIGVGLVSPHTTTKPRRYKKQLHSHDKGGKKRGDKSGSCDQKTLHFHTGARYHRDVYVYRKDKGQTLWGRPSLYRVEI